MELMQEFNRMMENTHTIALATSVSNIPNVRLMIFNYDIDKKGIVYISTGKGSPKTLEFLQNNNVTFTTIPVETDEHIRVTNATVQKSDLKITELLELFIKKYPAIKETFEQGVDLMEFYEIHFKEAAVTLGFNQHGKVTL